MFTVSRDQFELDDLERENLVHHYASILHIKEHSSFNFTKKPQSYALTGNKKRGQK